MIDVKPLDKNQAAMARYTMYGYAANMYKSRIEYLEKLPKNALFTAEELLNHLKEGLEIINEQIAKEKSLLDDEQAR